MNLKPIEIHRFATWIQAKNDSLIDIDSLFGASGDGTVSLFFFFLY